MRKPNGRAPKPPNRTRHIGMRFYPDLVKDVDLYAIKWRLTRSRTIEQLCKLALKYLEDTGQ